MSLWRLNIAAVLIGLGNACILLGVPLAHLVLVGAPHIEDGFSIIAGLIMCVLSSMVCAGFMLASFELKPRWIGNTAAVTSIAIPVLAGSVVGLIEFDRDPANPLVFDAMHLVSNIAFCLSGASTILLLIGLCYRSGRRRQRFRFIFQISVAAGIGLFLVSNVTAGLFANDGVIITIVSDPDTGNPIGFWSLLIGLVSGILLPFTLVEFRVIREPPTNGCAHCGYDRRFSESPVCPECGMSTVHHVR